MINNHLSMGRGRNMAFERDRKPTNPTRRAMSVADMSHPILKENQKVLKLLDEMDKKNRKIRWK
jgi:hypothetical protein